MEADKIWNKKSGKDHQILALTSMVHSLVEYANNVTSQKPMPSQNEDNKSSGNRIRIRLSQFIDLK